MDGEARKVVSASTPTRARAGRRTQLEKTERAERVNVFDQAVKYIADQRAKGGKVLISGWSEGSLDRLLQVLNEHGLEKIKPVKPLGRNLRR